MKKNSIKFRVGVVGHRNVFPEDMDAAIKESRKFLSWLKDSMPRTDISVITGLAEGADRIFAKAALALNMDVEAVLPMPLKYYKNDFDEVSFAELEGLLKIKDVTCIELPLTGGLSEDESSWFPEERNELYANLSNDLKHRANVLVAFWDGECNNLVGGTADTVMKYLGAVPGCKNEIVEVIDAGEAQLDGEPIVFWVPTRRVSSDGNSTVSATAHTPCWVAATGEKIQQWPLPPDDFCQELKELDLFNRKYTELSRNKSLVSNGNLLDDCSETIKKNLPTLQGSDSAYVMADTLALYFQARSDRLFKLFSLMAALMGLLFLLYAKIAAVQLLLIGYLVLFFSGVFLHVKGRKQKWFTRHLVYRCLAETLRVRFYLDLSGARESVYIREPFQIMGLNSLHGFSWIRHVLQATNPVLHISNASSGDIQQRITATREIWIENQAEYFSCKSKQLERRHHKLERIKRWIVGCLVVAAICLVFFKKTLIGYEIIGDLSLKTLLVFMMGLLPFLLGVWEMHQSKMAVKELMWQYRNQAEKFSVANQKLQQTGNLDLQRKIIAYLGKTSILDNFQWIIHRFHREQEPPTAG